MTTYAYDSIISAIHKSFKSSDFMLFLLKKKLFYSIGIIVSEFLSSFRLTNDSSVMVFPNIMCNFATAVAVTAVAKLITLSTLIIDMWPFNKPKKEDYGVVISSDFPYYVDTIEEKGIKSC